MTSARQLLPEIGDGRDHRRTVRNLPAAILLLVLGLAGCASSGSPSATTTTYAPNPAHAASAAPVAHHAFTSLAMTGKVVGLQGDKAEVTIGTGKPVPLTSVPQSEVTTCDVTNVWYQANRAVAIPVTVNVELTSKLGTPLSMGLDGTQQVASGGSTGDEGNFPTFIQLGASDGSCSTTGNPMTVTWNDLNSQGARGMWEGYLVIPGAITPDDLSGSVAKTMILLPPKFFFGVENADTDISKAASPGVVQCAGLMPSDAVAVSVKTALADGCTR
jgi:hypothetical protein